VCRQQFQDRLDAIRVAAHLGIPFRTWDFSREYRAAVVDYLIREYASGRTPNPDVMCNREIKFGAFLRRAIHEGADYVATGHYARLMRSERGSVNSEQGRPFLLTTHCSLLTGVDPNKDQSYFLWTLGQGELERVMFPIGEFTKPEVRAMAKKFGLPTAEKPDSQGICFIGEVDIREFLKRRIPSARGNVLTARGTVVGEHEGAAFYTIGQRHGIGVGGRPAKPGEARQQVGGIPYYVSGKDMTANTLTVAEGPYDEHLFRAELEAHSAHWVAGRAPIFPLQCSARIRYRQSLQTCVAISHKSLGTGATIREASFCVTNDSMTNAQLLVRFDEPQRAVTPGQSIVFYRKDTVLGGAIIAAYGMRTESVAIRFAPRVVKDERSVGI